MASFKAAPSLLPKGQSFRPLDRQSTRALLPSAPLSAVVTTRVPLSSRYSSAAALLEDDEDDDDDDDGDGDELQRLSDRNSVMAACGRDKSPQELLHVVAVFESLKDSF